MPSLKHLFFFGGDHMYEQVPDWLRPFLTEDAYNPNLKFLQDLDPQSRVEAILKFGFLSLINPPSSDYDFFLFYSCFSHYYSPWGRLLITPLTFIYCCYYLLLLLITLHWFRNHRSHRHTDQHHHKLSFLIVLHL